MNEHTLRNALKACLSEAAFSPERQQEVLRTVRNDSPEMKRKLPAALVFAIIMLIVIGGAALAAGLGAFSRFADANAQSAQRLALLDEASVSLEKTQSVQIPSAPEVSAPAQTLRDTIRSNLYDRRFTLTLNQSYTDGRKLYYAYTLTTDSPLRWYEGDGTPSGFDDWDAQEPGTYVQHYTAFYEEDQRRLAAFFTEHPAGYIAHESMSLGDGAMLNGSALTILDSGETRIDAYTIQGYQEVELPEGFTSAGEIEIELTLLYGATIYAQDGESVRWAHVDTPENRGILHLPFCVPLNGETKVYAGTLITCAYSAMATLRVSEVDASGEVLFDAPEWAAAFRADPLALPPVRDYMLAADGAVFSALDCSSGINGNGQYFIRFRFDLPESMNSLALIPVLADTQNETALGSKSAIPLR